MRYNVKKYIGIKVPKGEKMFKVKAEIIENFMKEHNMTNREFAKHCDVPMTAITRLLHTKNSYNLILLFRIACGIDIDVRKLFDEKES